MNYLKTAVQILEKSGYKITNTRLQVLQSLEDSVRPLSPYELQKIIPSKVQLNHVTIYRILELLQNLHLAHKVSSGGFIKCAIPNEAGCHHFLICDDCGTTKEFTEPHSHLHLPASLEKEFVVTSHTFELGGLCKKCHH